MLPLSKFIIISLKCFIHESALILLLLYYTEKSRNQLSPRPRMACCNVPYFFKFWISLSLRKVRFIFAEGPINLCYCNDKSTINFTAPSLSTYTTKLHSSRASQYAWTFDPRPVLLSWRLKVLTKIPHSNNTTVPERPLTGLRATLWGFFCDSADCGKKLKFC